MLDQVANTGTAEAAGENFNFFMVFYGIVLGLAVTELFSGFKTLLGEKNIDWRKIGVLTPLLTILILCEIISTFVDAWDQRKAIEITLDDMIRPTLIGVGYFMLSAIAVPQSVEPGFTFDDHFMERRRRFAGLLLGINLIILTYDDEIILPAIRSDEWLNIMIWGVGNLWLFLSYFAMMVSSRKSLVAALLIASISYYVTFYIKDPTCLYSEEERTRRPVCQEYLSSLRQ